jgi:hypothetical protein
MGGWNQEFPQGEDGETRWASPMVKPMKAMLRLVYLTVAAL